MAATSGMLLATMCTLACWMSSSSGLDLMKPAVAAMEATRKGDKLFFTETGPHDDVVVPMGGRVELQCEAGGSPQPTVYWLHNGQRVNSQEMEDREKSSDNSGLLKLGATRARLHRGCTTQADAGTYTCVAEAGFKSISSSTAVVIDITNVSSDRCIKKKSLSATKSSIVMWTTQILEFQHNDVQLYCRAEGSPKPQITWLTATGERVENDKKFELLPSGDLIIHSLEWADMGMYRCVARSFLGSDEVEAFVYPTTDS